MYGPNKEAAACACDDDQAILKPTNPLPNSTFHHKQQTKFKSKKNQKTIKSHPTHNGYKIKCLHNSLAVIKVHIQRQT